MLFYRLQTDTRLETYLSTNARTIKIITMKFFSALVIVSSLCFARNNLPDALAVTGKNQLKTGAEQTDKYLPYLRGKRVAMLVNQTSIIGKTHLVDSLKTL